MVLQQGPCDRSYQSLPYPRIPNIMFSWLMIYLNLMDFFSIWVCCNTAANIRSFCHLALSKYFLFIPGVCAKFLGDPVMTRRVIIEFRSSPAPSLSTTERFYLISTLEDYLPLLSWRLKCSSFSE